VGLRAGKRVGDSEGARGARLGRQNG